MADNQGRRFEQLVGESPVPWSVDRYGMTRRFEAKLLPYVVDIAKMDGVKQRHSRRPSREDDLFGS